MVGEEGLWGGECWDEDFPSSGPKLTQTLQRGSGSCRSLSLEVTYGIKLRVQFSEVSTKIPSLEFLSRLTRGRAGAC